MPPVGDQASRLASEKYIRLTTFRRDGTPVSTPVWVVGSGDHLLVVTSRTTGKAKRLGHTPRVLIAPCDGRGRVGDGVADVEGTATIRSDAGSVAELERLLIRKYGLLARAFGLLQRVRRKAADTICLEISVP